VNIDIDKEQPAMTRTVADRLEELRAIFEKRCNARIAAEFTDRVAQLHDDDPTCVIDDAANRVLRHLRGQPIVGKHLIYSAGPDGPWQLGRVTPGAFGNFTLEPATFDRLDDAMRAVFAARREAFRTAGHVPSASAQTAYEGSSK
jgi:hypothetical protein